MVISEASMARKVAYLAMQATIEGNEDARAISRAAHESQRSQLRLRDAEKWHAHKMQDIGNTVQVAQQAASTVSAVQNVGEAAQNADQQATQAEKTEQKPKSETPAQDEKAKAKEETREKLQEALKEQITSAVMEKFEHAQKQAHERADRHEELAAKMKEVGEKVRDDASAHLVKMYGLESEGALQDPKR